MAILPRRCAFFAAAEDGLMLHLFHRHRDPIRLELDEIKRVVRCLKSSDPQTRSGIGAGVYLANADFLRQFGAMEDFRESGSNERDQFYAQLADLELRLEDAAQWSSVGVGLYRIWLTDTLAGRRDAAELLGEELTELSRSARPANPNQPNTRM